ncbi:MAG: thrombospondin type 3 repeat-containing protein [Phycisphaerales bacterium]|nr:MAG: thrombospondin type 3 repeat-containing protein [Phycisphaerales bacterium]
MNGIKGTVRCALMMCVVGACLPCFGQDGPAPLEVAPDTPVGASPGTMGEVVYSAPHSPDLQGWYWGAPPGYEFGDDLHLTRSGYLVSFDVTVLAYGDGAFNYDGIVRFYTNDPADSIEPTPPPLVQVPISGIPGNTAYTQTVDLPDLGMAPVAIPEDVWMTVELNGAFYAGGAMLHYDYAPTVGISHNCIWAPYWYGDDPYYYDIPFCTLLTVRLTTDFDEDGVEDWEDNCADTANPDQLDSDEDDVGDACDNCPADYNPDQSDWNEDGEGDACDADVPDWSFEGGDLEGWEALATVGVVDAGFGTSAACGTYQAIMTNGTGAWPWYQIEDFLDLPYGSLGIIGDYPTEGSAIRRTVNVNAGDELVFQWNLLTDEITGNFFNDFAFVSIVDEGAILLADTFYPEFSLSDTTYQEETGYHFFSYTFPSDANVTIGFGVCDSNDEFVDSALLIDCIDILTPSTNAPPEITCNGPVVLWSPDHDLVDISSAFSVYDPDDDPVYLSFMVLSDESELPETGDGTGKHSPDFKDELYDNGRGLLVRSERRGPEDGRFYLLVITADDGQGGITTSVCIGAVVPHDEDDASLADVLAQADASAIIVEAMAAAGPVDPSAVGLYEHGMSEELGPKQ